jgi:hypothetical protein
MMPHERRLSTRKPLDQITYLSLPPNNGGVVQDISEGGLGFHAIAPLEADGQIQFRFAIDSAERIRAVGELAWIDETRRVGGLRFTQLPEEVRDQIRIWAGQSKANGLDKRVAQPVIEAALAPVEPGNPARDMTVSVAEPPIKAEAAPNSKTDSTPVLADKNALLSLLKPTIYPGLFNPLSMFPAEQDSEVPPQSLVVKHPIAAVGLTIALAFFVSIVIFTYVYTSRAGDLVFEWGEKMLVGSYSQPVPGDPAPPLNTAPGATSLPPYQIAKPDLPIRRQ